MNYSSSKSQITFGDPNDAVKRDQVETDPQVAATIPLLPSSSQKAADSSEYRNSK